MNGRSTMRASTVTTLVLALGLSTAGTGAALAEQYRGPLESVDTLRDSIRVIGLTIQADGHPIGGLDLTSDYVVTWESRGGRNVLTGIRPVTAPSS
jgi:hypothetical protein